MMGKVGMLRDFIKDLPDDADFLIEYPTEYSRKTIKGVQEKPIHVSGFDGESDFIPGGTLGKSRDRQNPLHISPLLNHDPPRPILRPLRR